MKYYSSKSVDLHSLCCVSSIMNQKLTGYGPSNQWQNLMFDGDERKFEQWEVRILGYMQIKKL